MGSASGAPEETREHAGRGGTGGVSPRWFFGSEAVRRQEDCGVLATMELRWAATASEWVCSKGRQRGK
jgi:hypothetical protein